MLVGPAIAFWDGENPAAGCSPAGDKGHPLSSTMVSHVAPRAESPRGIPIPTHDGVTPIDNDDLCYCSRKTAFLSPWGTAVDSLHSRWDAGTSPSSWEPRKLLSQPTLCLGTVLAFLHCINLRCCEVRGVGVGDAV